MKTILLLLLTAALAAAADPAPADVQTVRPEPADRGESVRLPARTLPSKQAYIYSRATGGVGERRADIGDAVKAGDILAVIDAPEQQRTLEEMRAKVLQAEAKAALARSTAERARTMARSRVIATEALDERESLAKTAEGELLAARAELAHLEELIAFQTIRAPFDAVVAGRRIEKGDQVQADQPRSGEWLFHLAKIDELLVEVFAPPAAALRIQPGQDAAIEFTELPGRKFPARVVRSSRVLDPTTGTMRVELLLQNPGNTLPSGLTGTAEITTGAAGGVLLVPGNAIFVQGGKAHVARVVEGRLDFTPVETGRDLGKRVEILSGLSPSDEIVLSPNALLRDAPPVQPAPPPPQAAGG